MTNLLGNSNLSISPSFFNRFGCFWSHFDVKTRRVTGKGLDGYGYRLEPRYPWFTPAIPYVWLLIIFFHALDSLIWLLLMLWSQKQLGMPIRKRQHSTWVQIAHICHHIDLIFWHFGEINCLQALIGSHDWFNALKHLYMSEVTCHWWMKGAFF